MLKINSMDPHAEWLTRGVLETLFAVYEAAETIMDNGAVLEFKERSNHSRCVSFESERVSIDEFELLNMRLKDAAGQIARLRKHLGGLDD